MADVLRIALVTSGDPRRLSGGFLYHQRIAELAPNFSASIEFVSFPEWAFPAPFLALPWLLGRLHRLVPDVILLDSLVAAYWAPVLCWRSSPWPVIGMLHQLPGGIDHSYPRQVIQRWLDLASYRRCAGLVACSQWLAEQMIPHDLSPDFSVLNPGNDGPELAGSASKIDLRRGRQAAVLCVANWQPVKGLDSLLQAFAELPSNLATLHLVGEQRPETDYGRQLSRRIAQPDLADRVVVHGAIAPDELWRFYTSADAFALCSQGETYGTVYAEAMSAGLPVVGWRTGNLPNLVTDGEHGILLDFADKESFTAALRRLCQDLPLAQSLGQAAQERAQGFPRWHDTTRKLVESVRQTLERSQREWNDDTP